METTFLLLGCDFLQNILRVLRWYIYIVLWLRSFCRGCHAGLVWRFCLHSGRVDFGKQVAPCRYLRTTYIAHTHPLASTPVAVSYRHPLDRAPCATSSQGAHSLDRQVCLSV